MNFNSHSEFLDAPRGDTTEDKNLVRSLAKGLRLMECFTAARPQMTIAEAARAAGLDNATAFRFLGTLAALGYVEKIEGTRQFRLTLKCLDLGFNAIGRSDLRTLARPLLRALVGEGVEAASLAVPDGADIVYVERVQAGLARLGVEVRIGSRAPAYSTAAGQALLAFLPRDAQIAVLEAAPRARRPDTTLTDLDALLAKLATVRAQGFALSDQENVMGLRVLAAPVFDADRTPIAAVSVAAPAFALSLEEFQARACGPVIAVAARLSRASEAAGAVLTPHTSQTAF